VEVARFVIHSGSLMALLERGTGLGGCALLAPGTARSEVLNLLYDGLRAGSLSRGTANRLLTRLAEEKVRYLSDRVLRSKALDTALELGLADTFLAEYVALARLHADALVIEDGPEREAVRGAVRTLTLAQAAGEEERR